MSVCIICNNSFLLPKNEKELDKLVFLEYMNEIEYMCSECFEDRAFSNSRFYHGVLLCNKYGCGRNASLFSKFCFKCDNEFER